ncbi:MAG: hypothetical protein V4819_01195 [Verrucomicrobiota bacterium]
MKTIVPSRRSKPRRESRGFALIVTLSLMILLTVIAVGLLSLSSISLRSSSQGQAMQTARANARLALMLALGDLQKSLGPDMRISARAETLAKDPRVAATVPPNTAKAWWLGVSHSDGKTPVGKDSGEPVMWLISGLPNGSLSSTLTNPVDIIKGGSIDLDSTNVPDTRPTGGAPIQAGRVPIVNAAGKVTGSYAYFVDDEGMKAQLAASHTDVRNDNNLVTGGILPGTHPISQLRGLTGSGTGDVAMIQKLGSPRDLALIGVSPATTKEKFFAYTTCSRGVLSDSRVGGLKKDLTIAFETPAVFDKVFPKATPDKFIAITPDKLDQTSDLKTNGYINWAIFRDYYNLKKHIQTKNGVDYLEMNVFANWGFSNTKAADIIADPFYTGALGPHAMKGTQAFHKGLPYAEPPPDVSTAGRKFLQYQSNPIFPLMLEIWQKSWLSTRFKTIDAETTPLNAKQLMANTQVFTSHYNPYNIGIYAVGSKDNKLDETKGLRLLKFPQAILDVRNGGSTIFFNPTAKPPAAYTRLSPPAAPTAGGDLSTLQPKLTAAVLENPTRGIKGAMMLLPGHSHLIGMGDNKPKTQTADGNIYTDKVSDSVNKSAYGLRDTSVDTTSGTFEVVTEMAMSEPALAMGVECAANDTGYDPELSQVFFSILAKDAIEPFDNVPSSEKRPGKIFKDTLARTSMTTNNATTVRISLRTTNEITKALRPLMDANIRAQWNNPKWDSKLGLDGLAAYSYQYSDDLNNPAPKELDMKPAPDGRQGWSYWGGGRQAGDGSDTVILFDVPRRDLVSIAQLQHAAAGRFSYEPSYIVGNSYANPRIPLGNWRESTSDTFSTSGRGLSQWKIGSNFNLYDASYLVNELLWDSYTFTTIPQAADNKTGDDVLVADIPALLARTKQLPNPRYIPYKPEGSEFKATNLQMVGNGTNGSFFHNAGHLLVDGSFNVNSTSIDAWEAFLTSTLDLPVRKLNEKGVVTGFQNTKGVRYPRCAMPTGTGMKTASLNENYWTGFRELTEVEVRKLATEIVSQIKDRGPFLTLSAFVNRKIGTDKNARSGALQAALDNTVNKGLSSGFQSPADAGTVPTLPDNSDQGSGFPGQLLQGDVLQALGPYMTVHSDTFTIRAYGEVKNGASITARAYCEAVVQRLPDPMKTGTSSGAALDQLVLPTSPLGRQFSIVSFRWLHESEI